MNKVVDAFAEFVAGGMGFVMVAQRIGQQDGEADGIQMAGGTIRNSMVLGLLGGVGKLSGRLADAGQCDCPACKETMTVH